MKFKSPPITDAIRSLRSALQELVQAEELDLTSVQVLRRLSRRFRTLGRSLTWLVAYDNSELRRDAFLLLRAALDEPEVPTMLRDKVGRQAVDLAERIIRDPGLCDEHKLLLSDILSLAGSELPPDTLESCFKDFVGTASSLADDAASMMLDTTAEIEGSLHVVGLDDTLNVRPDVVERIRNALSMGMLIAQSNARVGCTLLAVTAAIGHELSFPDERELCMALEVATQVDPRRALACLLELGDWPACGELGARARELSSRLRSEGVVPQPLPTPLFSHGLVSSVDGSGSRALQLLFRQSEGNLDALYFLLNDKVGLKDVNCAIACGFEAEQQLRESEVPLAPCDLGFARELIGDALATSAARGRRVPGRLLLYRSALGPEPIHAVHRTPRLDAYKLETYVRGPGLADESGRLAHARAFDQLGFDSDAAYDFVIERRGRKLTGWISKKLVTQFLQAVEAHERTLIIRRLAANLEIEARAGRARQKLNQLAARTWLVLDEELLPFCDVPYLRALAASSLQRIATNVSLGFTSQREADEASLEFEESF